MVKMPQTVFNINWIKYFPFFLRIIRIFGVCPFVVTERKSSAHESEQLFLTEVNKKRTKCSNYIVLTNSMYLRVYSVFIIIMTSLSLVFWIWLKSYWIQRYPVYTITETVADEILSFIQVTGYIGVQCILAAKSAELRTIVQTSQRILTHRCFRLRINSKTTVVLVLVIAFLLQIFSCIYGFLQLNTFIAEFHLPRKDKHIALLCMTLGHIIQNFASLCKLTISAIHSSLHIIIHTTFENVCDEIMKLVSYLPDNCKETFTAESSSTKTEPINEIEAHEKQISINKNFKKKLFHGHRTPCRRRYKVCAIISRTRGRKLTKHAPGDIETNEENEVKDKNISIQIGYKILANLYNFLDLALQLQAQTLKYFNVTTVLVFIVTIVTNIGMIFFFSISVEHYTYAIYMFTYIFITNVPIITLCHSVDNILDTVSKRSNIPNAVCFPTFYL